MKETEISACQGCGYPFTEGGIYTREATGTRFWHCHKCQAMTMLGDKPQDKMPDDTPAPSALQRLRSLEEQHELLEKRVKALEESQCWRTI